MLVYFKVGNYKSVKDPIVINFKATAISEHQSTNVHKKNKEELLKSIMLFGPNAGGKSKILDALVFFRWFIIHSATDRSSSDKINTEAFALSLETIDQPSFFEAEFLLDKSRYRYGFEADEQAIRKEWLMEVRPTTVYPIFLRLEQEFQIDHKKFPNSEGLESRTRKNALFISVAAQWNAPLGEAIIHWFNSIFTIHGLQDQAYREMTTDMLKDERLGSLINKLVCQADLGINMILPIDLSNKLKKDLLKDVPVEEYDAYRKRLDEQPTPVIAMHTVYNQNGEPDHETPFAFDGRESEGTRKFYNLIGVFVYAVLEGRMVIIDEMDARMHTLLSKAIIELFNSGEIKSEAQLLAVTHDTALMDRNLLRRDQIYFVEKDKYSATRITNLVEYKVRKETPFDKNYLEGKYGGIPFIENLDSTLNNGEKQN